MRRGTAVSDHWLHLRAALCFLLLIFMTACSAAPQLSAPGAPKTPVRVQLAWVHEYSSASFYAAEQNGHFATQNLAVELQAGGFDDKGYIEPIAQVVNGTVDFGITSALSLIQARADGKPVVAIATLFQRSPIAVLSLEQSGIQRPQDLIGRRVAVADGGARQLLDSLLNSQKIDPAQVTILPRTTFGIDPLAKGEVDAMVAWVINEGVQLEEAGLKTNTMLMSDYGMDGYEMVLFTTDKMVAEQPDTVVRFVQATVSGMQDVINNPEQSAKQVLIYDSKLDLEGQRRRIEATLPLMNPPGSKLGAMQPDIWALTHQIMLEQKVLSAPIAIDQVYTTTLPATASK